jgi:hypothetical protein
VSGFWATVVAVLVIAVLVLLVLLRRSVVRGANHAAYLTQQGDDYSRRFRDLYDEVHSMTTGDVRYEVLLADWGPDFTGYDGILPRWRWSVVDADRALRTALGAPPEIGTEEVPFMLGNAFFVADAMLAATMWIEEHQHPIQQVVLGEVEG